MELTSTSGAAAASHPSDPDVVGMARLSLNDTKCHREGEAAISPSAAAAAASPSRSAVRSPTASSGTRANNVANNNIVTAKQQSTSNNKNISPKQRGTGGGFSGESGPDEEDDDDEDDQGEEDEESSDVSPSDEDGSWITWFCSLRGNEFFCEVDEDYIQDDFNLTGLNLVVPYYDYALDMVLDVEMPMEDTLTEEQQEIVESAAEMLYGLIHARYVVTSRGMHAMYEKYRIAAFGRCPQVFCQGQPVLPVGLSDLPRNYTVNVFCPRCHGLYFPKSTRQANIDGAYFGTTFPHLWLMTHPDMIPQRPTQTYVPRTFGFKVNETSLYYLNREGNRQPPKQQQEQDTAVARTARRTKRVSGAPAAAANSNGGNNGSSSHLPTGRR